MNKNYETIGLQKPTILLPKENVDLSKWSVVACDQYTSQPEYWEEVYKNIGGVPSTGHIIFPEVYLEKEDKQERIKNIQNNIKDYIEKDIFNAVDSFIYVERTIKGKIRKGLMVALDLEKYDYNKGSQTLIRATEGTVLDRLPPRMEIREGALLESPHIMVLIDDPNKQIIEKISEKKSELKKVYDFELMMNGGHVAGYLVDEKLDEIIISGLEKLSDKNLFQSKYGVGEDKGVLLFAMGDGNHSLATAKAIWEKNKSKVGMDHPSRWALVELVNVHDEALVFEPIHRVVFGVKENPLEEMKKYFGDNYNYFSCTDKNEMTIKVGELNQKQRVGIVYNNQFGYAEIANPSLNLAVGTLQKFLDDFLKNGKAEKIDYVHGLDVVCNLSNKESNVGFYLPGMDKNDLFKTVILDGVLPRKTFSMGEAEEKRFYLECRKII